MNIQVRFIKNISTRYRVSCGLITDNLFQQFENNAELLFHSKPMPEIH